MNNLESRIRQLVVERIESVIEEEVAKRLGPSGGSAVSLSSGTARKTNGGKRPTRKRRSFHKKTGQNTLSGWKDSEFSGVIVKWLDADIRRNMKKLGLKVGLDGSTIGDYCRQGVAPSRVYPVAKAMRGELFPEMTTEEVVDLIEKHNDTHKFGVSRYR